MGNEVEKSIEIALKEIRRGRAVNLVDNQIEHYQVVGEIFLISSSLIIVHILQDRLQRILSNCNSFSNSILVTLYHSNVFPHSLVDFF